MKLKRVSQTAGERYGYRMECPGCNQPHIIPVKPHPQGWDFNENEACPTFSPSILVYETKAGEGATLVAPGTILQPRCHSFVRDGKWQFLADCGHALAGQTVDMIDIPETP